MRRAWDITVPVYTSLTLKKPYILSKSGKSKQYLTPEDMKVRSEAWGERMEKIQEVLRGADGEIIHYED
jgi:hypothetical protein